MTSELLSIRDQAVAVYHQIQHGLEAAHLHEFVAIEPHSQRYFLGKTVSEAIVTARAEFPDRLVHTFRIGHLATVDFGSQIRG